MKSAHKSSFIVALLSIVSFTCFAQQKSDAYTLVLNFYPSFNYGSTLIIKNNADSTYLKFLFQVDSAGKQEIDHGVIKRSDIDLVRSFFKTYKFQIKGSTDTLEVRHHPQSNGEDWVVYSIRSGTDGITTEGSFTENSIQKKFAFWTPKKDSDNQKLMTMLFQLMDCSLKKKLSNDYLRALRTYFQL